MSILNTMKIIIIITGVILLNGCQSSSNQTDLKKFGNNSEEYSPKIGEWVRYVFYNIPSPIEMANFIKQHNLNYDPSVLSGYGRENQFLTQEYQALNLGVYGADFSYCSVFNQNQEALKYLGSIRELTNMLKIPPEESNKIVQKLENNMENRDSLITLATDLFLNADSYLKENKRESSAVLILLGSWVEGMYIATHLKHKTETQEYRERISEQKFSFYNIFTLFETHKKENPLTKQIFAKLVELKSVFDEIKIKSGNVEIEIIADYKKAVLKAEQQIEIPETTLPRLKEELSELRMLILNKN